MLTDYFGPFTLARNSATGSFDTRVYATVGTYKGFIQPISGGETFRNGKAGEQATHRLYCPVSVAPVYGDKVTQQGQVYTVLYAIQPAGVSAVNRHKEIILGLFE